MSSGRGKTPRPVPPSQILAHKAGLLTVSAAYPADGKTASALWEPLRDSDDPSNGWDWEQIIRRYEENYLVTLSQPGAGLPALPEPPVVALMSATPAFGVNAERVYLLRRLEVHPHFRGFGIGPTAFAFAARRAVESGMSRLVLESEPCHVDLYGPDGLGGEQVAPTGWKQTNGMIVFTFEKPVLEQLRDDLNATQSQ